MLTAHARAFVSVAFQDRDGNQAATSLWFPSGISDADLEAAMGLFTARAGALSDAWIAFWQVTRTYEDYDFAPVSPGADLLRRLALFYRNGPDFDCIWVPAPPLSIFEAEGPYAGIRLDVTIPEIIEALLNMQSVITFIVTPEGDPFPAEFVVGGMAL